MLVFYDEKNINFKFYETDGQRLNEINASLFNWVIGAKRSFLKLLERNTGWDSLQTQIDYPGSCVNHGHQKSRDGCNWGWYGKTEAKMWLWKIRRNSLSIWAPNIMFFIMNRYTRSCENSELNYLHRKMIQKIRHKKAWSKVFGRFLTNGKITILCSNPKNYYVILLAKLSQFTTVLWETGTRNRSHISSLSSSVFEKQYLALKKKFWRPIYFFTHCLAYILGIPETKNSIFRIQ